MKWFWSESFWLPENTSWNDVTNGPDKTIVYAEVKDLWIQMPLTLAFLCFRYFIKKYCFTVLGKWLNIKDTKRRAPPNPVLEAAYKICTTCKDPISLAKQLDISERQVERWWRLRCSQDKPATLVKFCENMWQGSLYLGNFCLGLIVLWNKDWLWNIDYCFEGYPHQGITTDLKIYYSVSTSSYWSLTVTQFWDVRRKDFWQMFTHHIAAIALLLLSWIGNGHRVGTVVLLLHDSSDVILEFGKAAKYAGVRGSIVTAMFNSFAVVWILTRLVLYPYILTHAYKIVFWSPLLLTLCLLLWLLIPLHVIWTWIIIKIVYTTTVSGRVPEDTRSSDSEKS